MLEQYHFISKHELVDIVRRSRQRVFDEDVECFASVGDIIQWVQRNLGVDPRIGLSGDDHTQARIKAFGSNSKQDRKKTSIIFVMKYLALISLSIMGVISLIICFTLSDNPSID